MRAEFKQEQIESLKEDLRDALKQWDFAKKETIKAIEWEEKLRLDILSINQELKNYETTIPELGN